MDINMLLISIYIIFSYKNYNIFYMLCDEIIKKIFKVNIDKTRFAYKIL